jgi:hypothetical protein
LAVVVAHLVVELLELLLLEGQAVEADVQHPQLLYLAAQEHPVKVMQAVLQQVMHTTVLAEEVQVL